MNKNINIINKIKKAHNSWDLAKRDFEAVVQQARKNKLNKKHKKTTNKGRGSSQHKRLQGHCWSHRTCEDLHLSGWRDAAVWETAQTHKCVECRGDCCFCQACHIISRRHQGWKEESCWSAKSVESLELKAARLESINQPCWGPCGLTGLCIPREFRLRFRAASCV